MSTFLAQQSGELEKGSVKAKMTFATMVVSQFFGNIAKRNTGFGEFGTVGSFQQKSQDYFLDTLWKSIQRNFTDFHNAIWQCFEGIDTDNLRPFITKSRIPNIFSFFHLAFQNIQYDYVPICPSWCILTVAYNYSWYGRAFLQAPCGFLGDIYVPWRWYHRICWQRLRLDEGMCLLGDSIVGV